MSKNSQENILDRIMAYKRVEVAQARQHVSTAEIDRRAAAAGPVRPFARALADTIAQGRPALIAEIKKASPSKGLIRADFHPDQLAQAYARGGATCLSVLTDGPSFQGAEDHLVTARAHSALPVLRKDFLFDPYQVAQARAMGADCVLVILAAVSDAQAQGLCAAARQWSMDVLAEVHDRAELDRALMHDARLIGVNNRDLRSFETRLTLSEDLAPFIPRDRIGVAESGIGSFQDIARLRAAGLHSFLVGESLMRADDVASATQDLLGS